MGKKVAPWVEPVVLEGKFVRLEPLKPKHARELARHAVPDLFKYHLTLRPREQSVAALKEYIAHHRALKNTIGFTIVARETMKPVGSSSYMDIRDEHRGLEIGMTWIGKDWQGTAINPECKLLLLEHAFERLGAERVQLKTDGRNLQSQRAIEKLGAAKEGVLRKHMTMPDGFQRDTVMYSVIAEEWPAIKQRLIARLAALG
ncbi:MAG TPA: GNAT family protein [Fimbriimonadaceae bacterium]|nr:GNAT family protein [Fimbriimonadaceae bacterium]